ncbi:MAG: rod-binding protein [bacterium]
MGFDITIKDINEMPAIFNNPGTERILKSLKDFRGESFEERLGELKKRGRTPDEERKRLREASEGLESILIWQMLKEMRKTVPENSLIPKNQGERIFESMLDWEYASLMAKNARLGLAEEIYDQMSKYIS